MWSRTPASPFYWWGRTLLPEDPTAQPAGKFRKGITASLERMVGERDILAFADISGDHNELHIDEEFAAKSVFKERIAHGMLTASYVSAVLGMKLPGPGAILLGLEHVKFLAPVKIGDIVVATVTLAELLPKGRARFDCACHVGKVRILEGSAILKLPK